jgi:cell division initiation protein
LADEFDNQNVDFSSFNQEEPEKKAKETVHHTTKGATVNLSPLDIRKNEFKKSFRGYDVEDVTAFLDMVSMEYENVIRENVMLNEKYNSLSDQLKRYRDMEGTLQETLISAERTREDTLKNASKQAELIIREAEVKSISMIEEARRELSGIVTHINELKIQKDSYISRIKALIKSQLETFDNINFSEEDYVSKAIETVQPDDFRAKNRETRPQKVSSVKIGEDSDS